MHSVTVLACSLCYCLYTYSENHFLKLSEKCKTYEECIGHIKSAFHFSVQLLFKTFFPPINILQVMLEVHSEMQNRPSCKVTVVV
jgi:hypothetical protein